jgi:hypothetical protein
MNEAELSGLISAAAGLQSLPGPGTRRHSSKIRAVQVRQMDLSRILNIWEMA